MTLPPRPDPNGKRVSFFVTCIMDMIYPDTGMSVVKILERLGVEVDFPMNQTCCGQPGFNAGYHHESRQVAKQFLTAFANAEVIVTASGSCATMVRHEYPKLFAAEPDWFSKAERAASITWEFTEFIVNGLGVEDLNLRLPHEQTFAFHDACHGLRLLDLSGEGRKLLGNVENANVSELNECDVCCGFGGLFSVKMSDVSAAMLAKKINNINACPADTIAIGDSSCLMQINGGLSRQKSKKRARHIADILADGLTEIQKGSSDGD
jgi:L-lactate dehydrogenase complex protein LldE